MQIELPEVVIDEIAERVRRKLEAGDRERFKEPDTVAAEY